MILVSYSPECILLLVLRFVLLLVQVNEAVAPDMRRRANAVAKSRIEVTSCVIPESIRNTRPM